MGSLRLFEKILLFGLVLLALTYRILIQSHYAIMEDEFITMQLMEGIRDTFLPVRDGAIYWRSLLPNYLISIPAFFMEVNLFSARLVPMICAALTTIPVYLLAKRCAGTVAGVVASLFLCFSAFENLYACLARFYAPFQLFFVCAVLMAERYFIGKDNRFFYPLIAFTLASIMSHRFALELGPIFLLAAFLGGTWRKLFAWKAVLVFLCLGAAVKFFMFYSPSGAHYVNTTIPLVLGGNPDKWKFARLAWQFFPMGGTLTLLALAPVFSCVKRQWLYLLGSFSISLLLLSLLAPVGTGRYMMNFFPLGVVVVSVAFVRIVQEMWRWLREKTLPERKRWFYSFPFFILAILFFFVVENTDPRIAFGRAFTYIDHEPAHSYIAENFQEGDILISLESPFSKYYLGWSPQYTLREKINPQTGFFGPFPSDNQSANLIDSFQELQEVEKKSKGNVWIYHCWKIGSEAGPLIRYHLRRNYSKVFSFDETYVLLLKR